jgi:hypothetical protein
VSSQTKRPMRRMGSDKTDANIQCHTGINDNHRIASPNKLPTMQGSLVSVVRAESECENAVMRAG